MCFYLWIIRDDDSPKLWLHEPKKKKVSKKTWKTKDNFYSQKKVLFYISLVRTFYLFNFISFKIVIVVGARWLRN